MGLRRGTKEQASPSPHGVKGDDFSTSSAYHLLTTHIARAIASKFAKPCWRVLYAVRPKDGLLTADW
jgi:hypothetical protein